jgi:hypothetical protein
MDVTICLRLREDRDFSLSVSQSLSLSVFQSLSLSVQTVGSSVLESEVHVVVSCRVVARLSPLLNMQPIFPSRALGSLTRLKSDSG